MVTLRDPCIIPHLLAQNDCHTYKTSAFSQNQGLVLTAGVPVFARYGWGRGLTFKRKTAGTLNASMLGTRMENLLPGLQLCRVFLNRDILLDQAKGPF